MVVYVDMKLLGRVFIQCADGVLCCKSGSYIIGEKFCGLIIKLSASYN